MDETMQLRYIKVGLYVIIETKNEEIKRGFVEKILSKKDDERGIRVRLKSGEYGRVIEIPTKHDVERETFKFYNLLFHDTVYMPRHRKTKEWIVIPHPKGNLLILNTTNQSEKFKLHPDWHWQAVSSQRQWSSLVEKTSPDWVMIDCEQIISFEKFKELEKKFKEMP